MAKTIADFKKYLKQIADDNRYIYGRYDSAIGNGRYRYDQLMYNSDCTFGRDCCMYISDALYRCCGWSTNNWTHGYFWPHPGQSGYNYFLMSVLGCKKMYYNDIGYSGLKDGDILIGNGHTYAMFDKANNLIAEANDGYGGNGPLSIDIHGWIKYGSNPEVYRLPWPIGEYKEETPIVNNNSKEEFDLATIWTVQKGSNGGHVRTVQALLNSKNKAGLLVDGDCGNLTVQAIKNYQQKYGLYVDGVCGQKTWYDLVTRNV